MKNQTMKTRSVLLTIAFLIAGFVATNTASAHDGDGEHQDPDCRTRACRAALVDAKQATARYHDVQNALADGFVQVSPCVEHPVLGAMGFHFANFSRVMNPSVSPSEPEVLLYLPDENGSMRLVGLEYVVPIALATEPPVLFGQTFHQDGPPLNQYSLHVWAWRNNPSGIFAPFNPKLSCP